VSKRCLEGYSGGSRLPQLIITAVGPDHPGIVGRLTGRLQDAGGNILDSRMVNLRGQFAVVMLLECPPGSVDELERSLPQTGIDMGLTLHVNRQMPPSQAVAGVPMKLKTYSMDQPGIVHRITTALQAHGVNIEELTSRQESAPFMGTPLFLMEMRLTIPADVPMRKLRAELETLCDQMNCSLDFEPA
jgi:glycine cleavage system transcriptional repressor